MYCSKCGTSLAENAAFCTGCGQPTAARASMPATGAPAAAPMASPQVMYAGFWLRFVAYLIDSVVVSVAFLVALVFLAVFTGLGAALRNIHSDEGPQEMLALIGVAFILALVGIALIGTWLYHALMESSSGQATLGKKALDLEVTDLEGRRITFGRASGCHFAKIISGLIPFAIGYIVAGFTERKQAVHDLIASCLVVRKA